MVTIGGEGETAPPPPPKGAEEATIEHSKAEVTERALALPKVRKIAKERGIDLSTVIGTGPNGRITEADLDKVMKKSEPEPEKMPTRKIKLKYDFYGHIHRIPYEGLRELIGKRMETSKYTAPHATAMEEADVTTLWEIREGMNKELAKRGEKLTFLPFLIKALVPTLMEHPTLNAMLDEEEAEIVVREYYSIGIATDTPEGLIIPVVKRCETKGLLEIQNEMDSLIAKAKDRTIDLADLKGGTFTISNYGSIGGIYGVPILNFPESAILGIGRIRDEPRVVNGTIMVRKVMGISVSFDHRIVDGAEVARFLMDLKSRLESPGTILAETIPATEEGKELEDEEGSLK
jgi:pyruvate dehydrogenase E2 component (dihydrolipoamide acetyltransferase)